MCVKDKASRRFKKEATTPNGPSWMSARGKELGDFSLESSVEEPVDDNQENADASMMDDGRQNR